MKKIKNIRLRKKVAESLDDSPKGKPIRRFGEVRNECWNCHNYPRELNPEGDKGYYKCEYCGMWNHK